jgi:hypothetical protein
VICAHLQVLWIPEFFKARGAHSASLYAETFAVAAANLPGKLGGGVSAEAAEHISVSVRWVDYIHSAVHVP